VLFLARPNWGDQAEGLYVAGLLLDGAKLYGADWVDANPPLIWWLSELPVELSRWTGLSPQLALQLCLVALLALVILWSVRLIRSVSKRTPVLSSGGSPL